MSLHLAIQLFHCHININSEFLEKKSEFRNVNVQLGEKKLKENENILSTEIFILEFLDGASELF